MVTASLLTFWSVTLCLVGVVVALLERHYRRCVEHRGAIRHAAGRGRPVATPVTGRSR